MSAKIGLGVAAVVTGYVLGIATVAAVASHVMHEVFDQ